MADDEYIPTVVTEIPDPLKVDSALLECLVRPKLGKRFKLFLTGVIFPVLLFVLMRFSTMGGSIDSPWQSGTTEDYVAVLLQSPTVMCFVPMLIFNVVCMAIWCIRPTVSDRLSVRLGLYSGVIMSGMFLVLLLFTTFIISQIAAFFVIPGLALVVWIGGLLIQRFRRFTIFHLMIFTTCIAVMVAIDIPTEFFRGLIGGICMFTFFASPTLCFVSYCQASLIVIYDLNRTENPKRLRSGVGVWSAAWCAWIVGFLVTWKYAIAMMLDEYSKLPLVNPDCYVSSAAAHGHRRFVGSRIEESDVGPVNLQMRRLKLLEFALIACCPSLHRGIRSIYDAMGPWLAGCCASNKWFADLTFVSLKPIEWLSMVVQRAASVSKQQLAAIYRGDH